MSSTSNSCLKICILLFVVVLSASVFLQVGLHLSLAATPESAAPSYVISLVPEQLRLNGDVATHTNTIGLCPEPWFSGVPTGTIILGVDPTSCRPTDWDGGSATVDVFLPNIYSRTVWVLKLAWPDRDGKGLHSPDRDRMGLITLDGQSLWSKRTTQPSTFNDYYAAQHEPILTTIVVTESVTHTLTFSVPARTAWDLSQIELSASPYPTSIKGIGYSPFRDCQYPGGELGPSVQDIKEDLFRLVHTSNAIRTYSATGVNGQIPALANAIGLPVYAGAWLDYQKTTMAQDDAEIQAVINLANTTNLQGVIIGNEYYLRHRTTQDINYLRQRIVQVKNGVNNKNLPIMTAEIDDLMFDFGGTTPQIRPEYRPILDEVSVVMVHIYPFWGRLPIDNAAAYVVNRYKAIQSLIAQQYPGQNKRVIIGETGWPSAGAPQGAALPSPANQHRFLLEFLRLAEQEGVEYMYFDAFDELWKIEEPGDVGKHWGYSYTDRSAKYDFYGVLLPAAALPVAEPSIVNSVYLPYVASGSARKTFPIYTEWPEGPEHFVPSGWMGDIGNIGFFGCDRTDPHSGEMATRVSFTPTGTLGWAGIYWQYPENNWGNINDGFNLSWANKLTFWAKGDRGGEKIRFFVGGIGTQSDPYPDSLRPAVSTGFIQLSDHWQSYTIDLRGQNLSHVIGGFGWATDKCANPTGATFYLDDIFFESDPNMPPPPPTNPVFPVYTDAGAQSNHYVPSGWMGDGVTPGRVSLTECWYDNPHSGQTSIKIDYTQKVVGWAGIYWVDPAENWGDQPGGYSLTGADRLTFWARSDTPNARVKFLVGGIGYYEGVACSSPLEPFPDSVCPRIEQWETLSTTWKPYTIDLHQYPRNLSKVVGGFGWVAEDKVVFYLDDIVYEFNPSAQK